MQTGFQIVAYVSLGHNTLMTNPEFLQIFLIATLAEGRLVEQISMREELVKIVLIKMTDVTHHLVGIHQPAVRSIEGKPDNRILED